MKSPESEFVTVGKVLSPWGTEGKLKIQIETDFPDRFTSNSQVYLDRLPVTIDSAEWHNRKLIIKFNDVDRIEDAQKLGGQIIEIPRSQAHPLPEGQYYYFQIIGLEVRTIQGGIIGNVTEVLPSKSNDNYMVHGSQGEILIPAIEDVVKSIDLDKGLMTIDAIDGLLSLNKKAKQTGPANSSDS